MHERRTLQEAHSANLHIDSFRADSFTASCTRNPSSATCNLYTVLSFSTPQSEGRKERKRIAARRNRGPAEVNKENITILTTTTTYDPRYTDSTQTPTREGATDENPSLS
jgi:hypothetical protein